MKKFFFLILFLPVFVSGQMKQISYDANSGTGVRIDQDGHIESAVVFLPEGYETKATWPTILYFHGAGESSKDRVYSKVLGNGLPKNIVQGMKIPYIVIAVQDQWSTPTPAVMDYVLKNTFRKAYNIDTTHIYTTGLSYGGGGALAMAVAYPEYISAVVSASPSALQPGEVASLPVLAKTNIPVWFWYGTKDTGPFGDNAKSYAGKITSVGGLSWITTEAVGHGPWDPLYKGVSKLDGRTVYDFFAQYGKVAVPPPVTDTPVKKLLFTLKVYSDGTIEKM